jgi:hypothetical protein
MASDHTSSQEPAELIRLVTGIDYEIVERTPTGVILERREKRSEGGIVRINLWISGPRGACLIEALITEFLVFGGPNDDMVVKALVPNGNTFASITAEFTRRDDLSSNVGSFELNRR